MRESFVLHSEYIEDLPEEYKPVFLGYVYNYGIHGTIPELKGLELSLWIKIQRRIDQDIEAWEDTKNKRSEAGKKHSGNQYTRQNKKKMEQMEQCSNCSNEMEQNGTNGTVFDSVNDSVNDFVNDFVNMQEDGTNAVSKNKKFVKPTLEEIKAYCVEKNYTFNPESFLAYYESNGWKVGRNPMKSWQSACTTWQKNNFSPHGKPARDSNISEYAQFFGQSGG